MHKGNETGARDRESSRVRDFGNKELTRIASIDLLLTNLMKRKLSRRKDRVKDKTAHSVKRLKRTGR